MFTCHCFSREGKHVATVATPDRQPMVCVRTISPPMTEYFSGRQVQIIQAPAPDRWFQYAGDQPDGSLGYIERNLEAPVTPAP